ncbi:hypothetical protein CPB83DRAFT_876503 [Crepidotus variabilis]|uniref:Glucose receptor Git3 N-terminal domain-containing protein n=1 Tax=Crepidotus variabilis TaxID=179855 RepID=A0A9P6EE43_9AGAR|nr:hypothetical protein CPB83DRAFT_876503 [Crepidotus variabilis]
MSNVPKPVGVVCSDVDWARDTNTAGKDLHCLTRGDSIGLTVVSEACLLSLIAVVYVFLRILRNVIWRLRRFPLRKFKMFHTPMDLLMFGLFFADILQAVGGVLDLRWIHLGKVEVGEYCNAQGIVQSIGETAVAMTTLTIAIFTFLGVWMGKNITSMFLTRVILAGIWLFIAVVVIVGNTVHRNPSKEHFQSPTPYWCWVANDYMPWKILGEYIWFWFTLGVLLFAYTPLFFWVRGNIVIHDPQWWKFHFQRADETDPEIRAKRKRAFVMAAYPAVYCINILPFSVVRWITFSHAEKNTAAATFAVTSIYGLSGLFNVILLLSTKPDAGLFGPRIPITSA